PTIPLIIRFAEYNSFITYSIYPEGIFRRSQLLGSSISLSPHIKVIRSICTSESLRTSTRVFSGFILLRYNSPYFGFQYIRPISAPLHGT
ncbi:unnamed protein product, partial [Onchocerca ochengi]